MTTQVGKEPTGEMLASAIGVLKLLADPTRLKIMWALLHGEHCVGELAEHVEAQPAAVSQHLAKLRLAGLVVSRREGNHIFYLIDDPHLHRLVSLALSYEGQSSIGKGAVRSG